MVINEKAKDGMHKNHVLNISYLASLQLMQSK